MLVARKLKWVMLVAKKKVKMMKAGGKVPIIHGPK